MFFSKNPALDTARKLHKKALLGKLEAEQTLDWAESMVLYHTQRVESLAKFVEQAEAVEREAIRKQHLPPPAPPRPKAMAEREEQGPKTLVDFHVQGGYAIPPEAPAKVSRRAKTEPKLAAA